MADALDVPVSSGEWEPNRWRFADLIRLGNPDIVQPDILAAGGISELRRIAALASAANKPVMPHCSPTIPLTSLASLHLYSTLLLGTRPHEYTTEGAVPLEEALQRAADDMFAAAVEGPASPSPQNVAVDSLVDGRSGIRTAATVSGANRRVKSPGRSVMP